MAAVRGTTTVHAPSINFIAESAFNKLAFTDVIEIYRAPN